MGRLRRPVQDRVLAADLALLRYDAGLTQKAAAALMPGWSESRISRIENGLRPIGFDDLPALLDAYGTGPERTHELIEYADQVAPPAGTATANMPAASKLDLILAELRAIRELLEKVAASA